MFSVEVHLDAATGMAAARELTERIDPELRSVEGVETVMTIDELLPDSFGPDRLL